MKLGVVGVKMWREQKIPGGSWVTEKLGKVPMGKRLPRFET